MDEKIAFDEIIRKTDKLPTLPGIALRLIEAVRREDPDLVEITNIISSDPPLSAEVLKFVNSPFYSLKAKVTSVNHAVNMLGLNTVKNLALSFSLVNNFQSQESFNFDYKLFWKESLIGAVSARSLAAAVQPNLTEDAFFLGLLHNLGILTLVKCLPKQYGLVLNEMQNSGCTYHEAEDHVLGFNHMAVGKSLIKSWGLPELLYAPVGCHHQPEKLSTTSPEIKMLTKILHLSSLYIDLFDSKDTCFTLQLIEHYAKKYEFSDKLKIDEIGSQIYQHTQQIFPMFEISPKDENDYTELLESARKEIINLANDLMHRVVQQQAEIERLREQIIQDGMTPLINYQYFIELLNQEIYRSKRYKFPVSIIIADIDDLKSINEKFGQTAGDYVIKTVAECLRKELRQSDHVARYGSDEFGLILPETELKGGLQAAERLKEAISSMNIVIDKQNISCSLSFGVASLLPDQGVARDEFIKMAEKALATARAKGKNQCAAIQASVTEH